MRSWAFCGLMLLGTSACALLFVRAARGFIEYRDSAKYVMPLKEYRKQVMAPYDDVEGFNAGYQLEWIQRMRGERPVYITPQIRQVFVRKCQGKQENLQ